jgi:hypothetical protein
MRVTLERETRTRQALYVALDWESRTGVTKLLGRSMNEPLLNPRDQVHSFTVCVVDLYYHKHADRTPEQHLISASATAMRTSPAITDLPYQT